MSPVRLNESAALVKVTVLAATLVLWATTMVLPSMIGVMLPLPTSAGTSVTSLPGVSGRGGYAPGRVCALMTVRLMGSVLSYWDAAPAGAKATTSSARQYRFVSRSWPSGLAGYSIWEGVSGEL